MRRILWMLAMLAAPTAGWAQEAQGSAAAGGDNPQAEKPAEPQLDVSKLPFTADSIKKVVVFHQPKIQACYEDILATTRKTPPEGKLMTSWVINPDGFVKSAKVQKRGTTLRNPKLHDCVVSTLAAMTFPKPPQGQSQPIEYPFNLKAEK